MTKLKKRVFLLFCLGIAVSLLITEFVFCSITLKTVVVNPSQTQTQQATLKAYLPKEVTPGNILDLGDLNIDYDIEKGLYYVHREVELEPGESVSRQIEIEDVWTISELELEQLVKKSNDLTNKLEGTNYFETALAINKNINSKYQTILNKQADAADALPQTHIVVYRENQRKIDEIEELISKLQKMVDRIELSRDSGKSGKVSIESTWWMIIGVVVFLGLVSFILFILWHKQAKVLTKDKNE
ncbi:MAG: hypothetical protein K9L71_03595 [Candidatus Omnitrophica bacterium]|nr:hypothetical protein [Candidatus Omnitrophota bacterium]